MEEKTTEESEGTEAPEAIEEKAKTDEEETEDEILEEEKIEEPPPRLEEEKDEFVEERIYTIPLRRAWTMPPKKRAPRAIRIIKSFVQKNMKIGQVTIEVEGEGEEEGRIIISNEVNEKIWSRGIEKPPRKLRIRAAKDTEGNVTIFLA